MRVSEISVKRVRVNQGLGVPRMIESAPKTFMPIQTQDLHKVPRLNSSVWPEKLKNTVMAYVFKKIFQIVWKELWPVYSFNEFNDPSSVLQNIWSLVLGIFWTGNSLWTG